MIQAFKRLPGSSMGSTERLVCYMLADHHNEETGRCDPSVALLAEETSLNRTSVLRALANLEAKGYLTPDKREGARSSYRLHPDAGTSRGARPVAERDPSRSATPTSRGARPDQSRSATGPVAERDPNRNKPERTQSLTGLNTLRKPPVKQASIAELCIQQANDTKFFLTPPAVVVEAYRKYQTYRTNRAKGLTPEKKHHWKPEAAERDIKRIESALLNFPPEIVADQILTAIEKGWQTCGAEYLTTAPSGPSSNTRHNGTQPQSTTRTRFES